MSSEFSEFFTKQCAHWGRGFTPWRAPDRTFCIALSNEHEFMSTHGLAQSIEPKRKSHLVPVEFQSLQPASSAQTGHLSQLTSASSRQPRTSRTLISVAGVLRPLAHILFLICFFICAFHLCCALRSCCACCSAVVCNRKHSSRNVTQPQLQLRKGSATYVA